MRYCTSCLLPDTKPGLEFDANGVCGACNNYANREEIDWKQRENELKIVLEKYKSNGENWDCIVPVSGGKDSTYQVIKLLEYGMNPLCVTASTCDLSDIGRKNIENIQKLGVDHIEFTTNRIVRAKMNKIGLIEVGDISWPEHASIFTIPVRAAVQFNVPLIVWGENPQNEYGGPAASGDKNVLDSKWLGKFGGLLGLSVEDMVSKHGIERKHLIPYQYPSDEELARVGVTGIFIGYYIPWDGFRNALISQNYGFTSYSKIVEGSVVNYENLDNHQTGIHDYFKFLKFGFGRATDIASIQIRRGVISRTEGLNMVKMHDGKFPWACLGKTLEEILAKIDMTVEEFIEICDRYTNKDIFQTDSKGNLIEDKKGNLMKKVYDNS